MICYVKKLAPILLALLVCCSAFLGCSSKDENELNIDADTMSIEDEDVIEDYHDLSSNGSIQVTNTIEDENIFFVSPSVGTNSHEISITNRSGVSVVVYLYSEKDTSEAIRQMTVSDNETKSFSGLTSRFYYTIGISADISTQLNITITD